MVRSEEEQLKDAEESEHAQMTGVIMRRMRQISMTESDNVVDIAKQVRELFEIVVQTMDKPCALIACVCKIINPARILQ